MDLSFQSLRRGRKAGNIEHPELGVSGLFIVLVLLAETTRTIAVGFAAVISWFGVIGGALTLSYTCHRVSQNTLSNLVSTLADKLTYENAGSSTYTESQWRFILNS